MEALFILVSGVCCALLCHWMIRHTFTEYEWVELEEPAKDGGTLEKVWNEKLQLPRWVYILIWVFCIILSPIAFIAPIVVGSYLIIKCDLEGWKFIYNNKVIGWLTRKV